MPSNEDIEDEEEGEEEDDDEEEEEEEKEDNSPDIIPSLVIGLPFKIRPDQEKLIILRNGRPLPKLNIVKRDIIRNCSRTFQSAWYKIHTWLCGSKNYNKLFCWPCTLMRPETSSWSSTGNDDLKRFTSLAVNHAICKTHVKAIAEYDATLVSFNLPPEFVFELNFKYKEEDEVSDQTDQEDEADAVFHKKGNENRNKIAQATFSKPPSNLIENKTSSKSSKAKSKITFKTWQELTKDTFPVSSSKFFEEHKLFKWKRKIAKQELRNARLLGEKLKFEIEILKAKAEYYKLLHSGSVNLADCFQKNSLDTGIHSETASFEE